MDAVWASPQGISVRKLLPEKPSHYFRRQCWISADPDETTLRGVMDVVGPDRFFWASDFPHPDHPPDYLEHLARLVEPMAPAIRDGILRHNVLRAYRLEG
jgi:predicted TIM-barrel fold metal-dependent hydrolase